MRLIFDTNVLVYTFVTPEFVVRVRRGEWAELHARASKLYEDVLSQKHTLFIPSIVLVELGSVIAGLTNDEEKARRAVENVKSVAWVVHDDPLFTEQSINQAISLRLSGFDTEIATCAIVNSANLITNDKKFYDKFSPKAEEHGIKVYLLRQMDMKEIENLE
jgi:predicted nucleic acid-binding protein